MANWDQIKGNWNQVKGQFLERWDDLTSDELAQVRGDRDQLVGLIQEHYGDTREDINDQIDEWAEALKV